LELNPTDVIAAVLGVDAARGIQRFLGTGSIVGDGSVLLTADHVTRDWPGPLAIVRIADITYPLPITLIERDRAHDLALFRVQGYRPPQPLRPLFDYPLHPNRQLLTFECGTTVVAGREIRLSPATRLGHMTRMLDLTTELRSAAGDNALELSWPALRGASGAPVLVNNADRIEDAFGVVGVIVANAAYHLLPAQIESVLNDQKNMFEEIRYMLPQAVAVNICHLRPMYERALAST
jgi:hypothetical protein